MAITQLDRLVKGAPPPGVSPEQVAAAARRSPTSSVTAPQAPPLDPVSHLPSSPPQIYLNLLILESSLRAQYLSLRARLRLYVFLLALLTIWTLGFTYMLFLKPREDGSGTGGSVYWMVDMMEKTGWVGGMVTWGLVWGTGLYDRGVRWPRRWVGITNRGLRVFMMKVVVIKGSYWHEMLGYLSLVGPYGWTGTKGMRYELLPRDIERATGAEKDRPRKLEDGRHGNYIEEDVAPGGDTIKLLLLPKPFSPDFREEWDTYRTSYWEKENERRAVLRKLIKERDREMAKKEGGWLWWTGWRGWQKLASRTHDPPPKVKTVREKSGINQVKKEKRRDGMLSDSGSRNSSRSSTPTPEPDGRSRRPSAIEERRSSTGQRGSVKKKPAAKLSDGGRPSLRIPSDTKIQQPSAGDGLDSDVRTSRAIAKRSSNLSMSSTSDDEIKVEEIASTDADVKEEKP